MPNVVIVYGALRSGTTLLRLMLHQNPALSCPGEADYVFDHIRETAPGLWGYESETLERDRIYRQFVERRGAPASDPTLAQLITQMGDPGQTVVLMLHRNLSRVLDCLPGVPVIHMIRDPRDVARSSIGMGWTGNVFYSVMHWLQTEGDWARNRTRIDPAKLCTLKYEELIEAPEAQLARLCDFAGAPYDATMLNYDTDTTYSKPDPSLTYQWKRKMSARDIGLVEGSAGDLLTDLGYEPSGHPILRPEGIERLKLNLQNRKFSWSNRIQRYGVVDPLLAAVAKKIGTPSLAYAAQRRMDEKVKKYLK